MTLLEHVPNKKTHSTKPVDHTKERKQCSICGKLKLQNEFHFKTSKSTIERRAQCKKCNSKISNDNRKRLYYEWFMIYSAKHRALKKGLEFNLVPEDIVIPNVCPLIGIPIVKGEGKIHSGSPSLDRIDNTKGYTKDNV